MSDDELIKIDSASNVVGITKISDSLDLEKIYRELEDSTYEPEQFSGLTFRSAEPQGTVILFTSGKIICTGAKNQQDIKTIIERLVDKLKFLDHPLNKNYTIEIKNMVFTRDLNQTINLAKVALTFGLENVDYEPDDFAGLIYKVEEPPATFIIFESGKVICTGLESTESAESVYKKLKSKLKRNKLIK